MDIVLVTGSSGLIGSEVCTYFAGIDYSVHGIDNNQRASFLGPEGDTRWNQYRLQRELARFEHHELDVRDRHGILDRVGRLRPAIIVHAAAQPSHDRAAAIPFDDFDTNVRLAGIRDRTFSMVCSALYATTKTTETLITL